MTSHNHSHLKFRPVLTLGQIQYLATLVDQYSETPIAVSIKRILVPLIAKIEVGAINPAYKLSETHAIKLSEAALRKDYESGAMTPEQELEYEAKILGI